jgi:hypothetical protein
MYEVLCEYSQHSTLSTSESHPTPTHLYVLPIHRLPKIHPVASTLALLDRFVSLGDLPTRAKRPSVLSRGGTAIADFAIETNGCSRKPTTPESLRLPRFQSQSDAKRGTKAALFWTPFRIS